MRLNGNQIQAMNQLREEEDMFHFDVLGTDPLDKRVVEVKAWDFDFNVARVVLIDENGSVFQREGFMEAVKDGNV